MLFFPRHRARAPRAAGDLGRRKDEGAKGGYASVNGLELYYEVDGEGGDFLSEERPEEVTAAISNLLSTRNQP
jgi:hypothetical protein